MRRITKTQRAMILAAQDKRCYRPQSREAFEEMRTLVGLGIFEDSESVPGAFQLTDGGEKDAIFLREHTT